MLLEVDKLNTFYGNLHAIWDISIEVGEGEIVALIGSNGAGKSTLLKTLAGSVPMRSGEIRYQGRTLAPSQMKANHLVREGIILCPEGRHIFPRMPVEENLRTRHRRTGCKTAFRSRPTRWPNCDGSLRSWELRACKPCGR